MTGVTDFRQKLDKQLNQQDFIRDGIAVLSVELENLENALEETEEARNIIQEAAKRTQEQLQIHISDLCSMALAGVFKDPYELELEFVERRNKTEADIWFVRNGEFVNPLDASGGGAVDVAAFALRVAMWAISKPQPRPVLILDEPCKFLDRKRLPKAAEMLKQISSKLEIQIIMVTHSREFIDAADKVFEL